MSKVHAHFQPARSGALGGGLELVDLSSQNGTFVNGRLIKPNHAEWVGAGDAITFGAVETHLVDGDGLFDLLQT
jgi:hypothetical protein